MAAGVGVGVAGWLGAESGATEGCCCCEAISEGVEAALVKSGVEEEVEADTDELSMVRRSRPARFVNWPASCG